MASTECPYFVSNANTSISTLQSTVSFCDSQLPIYLLLPCRNKIVPTCKWFQFAAISYLIKPAARHDNHGEILFFFLSLA